MLFSRARTLFTAALLVSLCKFAHAGVTSTPAAGIDFESSLNDARALAHRYPGADVVRVVGTSMQPYFADGAVLVYKPLAAEKLRPGMMVVYRNRFDEVVAHRVIRLLADGWEVRGYNNDQSDSTRVTERNLCGVIYAVFQPRVGRHARNLTEGSFVGATTISSGLAGTPVALAAPAR